MTVEDAPPNEQIVAEHEYDTNNLPGHWSQLGRIDFITHQSLVTSD